MMTNPVPHHIDRQINVLLETQAQIKMILRNQLQVPPSYIVELVGDVAYAAEVLGVELEGTGK